VDEALRARQPVMLGKHRRQRTGDIPVGKTTFLSSALGAVSPSQPKGSKCGARRGGQDWPEATGRIEFHPAAFCCTFLRNNNCRIINVLKYACDVFKILKNRALRPPTYRFFARTGPEKSMTIVIVGNTLPLTIPIAPIEYCAVPYHGQPVTRVRDLRSKL
jgi:hypothetical protein